MPVGRSKTKSSTGSAPKRPIDRELTDLLNEGIDSLENEPPVSRDEARRAVDRAFDKWSADRARRRARR